MNKNQKFLAFVESMRDSDNSSLIESIKEGFTLVEAAAGRVADMPDIGGNAVRGGMDRMRERNSQPSAKPLTQEEQQGRHNEFARQEKKGAQDQWRVSGGMKQILNYAMTNPTLVEKWMNEQLKPAILAGKKDTDSMLGTDSAKKSLFQRMKSAAGAFTESEDDGYTPDEEMEEFSTVEDEDESDRIAYAMDKFGLGYDEAKEKVEQDDLNLQSQS